MATTNMRYDHPQYVVNVGASGVISTQLATAAVGKSVAMVAFCDTIVNAVHVEILSAGTSTAVANVGQLLGVHIRGGTGVTASGTSTLIAANGVWGTGLAGTSILTTATLSRGDTYRVLSTGTDVGMVLGICIEGKAIPGASVTS